MPTGPGGTVLAKPRPRPPTTAVPQSGPITSRSRSLGGPLEHELLLERHVVAEDHHVVAGVECVHRLDERAGARDRDERPGRRGHGAAHWPWSWAAPPRSVRRRAGSRRAAPGRRRRAPRPASRDRPVAARPRGRWWSPRPGPRSPSRSSTSMFRPVAIATWAASTPSRSCTARLTWSRVTESAYAPGRSSTCRNPSPLMRAHRPTRTARLPPSGRPRAARSRSSARRRAGPSRLRPVRAFRARRRTPRTAAAPRRAARSRAALRTARWCRCIRMRTASSTTGVGTPAARCMASQPQSTSSPRGVRPSPAPTRPVDGVGVQRGHGIRRWRCVRSRRAGTATRAQPADHERDSGEVQHAADDVRRTGAERRPGRPCGCRARRAPGQRAGRRPRHTTRPRRGTPRACRGARPGPVHPALRAAGRGPGAAR